MKRNLLMAILLSGCLGACQYFKEQQPAEQPVEGTPVARVGNAYLMKEEVMGLLPSRYTPDDSANVAGRYVNSWVKKQLMLQNAEESMEINEAEIQRKIQDYRYQLIVYAYEQQIISEQLDTAISDQEIVQYYQENLDNFQLKQNIIKGRFMKLPKEAPRMKKVQNWIRSDEQGEVEKLLSYARTFSDAYLLEDSVWIDFEDITANTPFKDEITNPVNTLKNTSYLETSDSAHVYLLRIKEYKIREQVSPLPFVKDRVRDILLNKRAVTLKQEHEDKIYQKALEKNLYEIY